ncbi:MAG TPA: EthD family reductase, partial [Dehalococcoidia bacterium]|nr:EthD family reductase [Dehalococcoidia bacterium]
MVKISILYYRPEDPETFERYYIEKHLPLAGQIPGLKKLEVGRVLRGPKDP